MIFTVRMVTLWRPSASSPLYWMQTQVWGSESQFLPGISVSYFNDKTTCLLACYRSSENIFWRVLKDLFVKRFSLIFQGSRPAGKDQPPKVYESFPVRVEENKIPVQHRGFGKPRWEESGKLAAGSNHETFTRYLESIKHLLSPIGTRCILMPTAPTFCTRRRQGSLCGRNHRVCWESPQSSRSPGAFWCLTMMKIRPHVDWINCHALEKIRFWQIGHRQVLWNKTILPCTDSLSLSKYFWKYLGKVASFWRNF